MPKDLKLFFFRMIKVLFARQPDELVPIHPAAGRTCPCLPGCRVNSGPYWPGSRVNSGRIGPAAGLIAFAFYISQPSLILNTTLQIRIL